MSNRRSLIGEVSLPKTSEKVWNKISGTVSFDMGQGYFVGQVDFPLQSTMGVFYISPMSKVKENMIFWSGTTSFHKTLLFSDKNDFSIFKILSWTPLEDDNYKYIVFPMYLEVGDNGDKGKMLYEYLTVNYPDSYSDGLPEKIYVNGDIKPYLHSGYRLTDGGDYYVLDANGSITYEKYDTGGAIN